MDQEVGESNAKIEECEFFFLCSGAGRHYLVHPKEEKNRPPIALTKLGKFYHRSSESRNEEEKNVETVMAGE